MSWPRFLHTTDTAEAVGREGKRPLASHGKEGSVGGGEALIGTVVCVCVCVCVYVCVCVLILKVKI